MSEALEPRRDARGGGHALLLVLFAASGAAALVYQVVWQRLLFAAFGVDVETVTVVVSVFMFGLGLGALAGGHLASGWADGAPGRALRAFFACELGIGLFGLASRPAILAVAEATAAAPRAVVALACFGLLAVPTVLMGATLPLLVAHLHRHDPHLGRAMGTLYAANTLGSAVASFATIGVLLAFLGLQATLGVAAALNLGVGLLGFAGARRLTGPRRARS